MTRTTLWLVTTIGAVLLAWAVADLARAQAAPANANAKAGQPVAAPVALRGDKGPATRPGEGREDGGRFSPEEFNEVLAVLREQDPELARNIEEARARDPQKTFSALRHQWPMLGKLLYLKRNDPQIYQLKMEDIKLARQSRDLARQLKQAREKKDEAKAKAFDQDLRILVRKHFALRQQTREVEVSRLEKRIAELRAKVEERKQNQDKLIDERVTELLGDVVKPEW